MENDLMVNPRQELEEGVSKDLYNLVEESLNELDTLGGNDYISVGNVLYFAGQMRENIRKKFIEIKEKYKIK